MSRTHPIGGPRAFGSTAHPRTPALPYGGGSPPPPSPRQTALTWPLAWATIRPRVDWLPDRVPASAAISAPRCLLSEATPASPPDRVLVGQSSLLPLCLQGNARLSSLLELGRCLVLLIGRSCDRASPTVPRSTCWVISLRRPHAYAVCGLSASSGLQGALQACEAPD